MAISGEKHTMRPSIFRVESDSPLQSCRCVLELPQAELGQSELIEVRRWGEWVEPHAVKDQLQSLGGLAGQTQCASERDVGVGVVGIHADGPLSLFDGLVVHPL